MEELAIEKGFKVLKTNCRRLQKEPSKYVYVWITKRPGFIVVNGEFKLRQQLLKVFSKLADQLDILLLWMKIFGSMNAEKLLHLRSILDNHVAKSISFRWETNMRPITITKAPVFGNFDFSKETW